MISLYKIYISFNLEYWKILRPEYKIFKYIFGVLKKFDSFSELSTQHAKMHHVETRHKKSDTAKKMKCSKQYKISTGRRLWSGKDNEDF